MKRRYVDGRQVIDCAGVAGILGISISTFKAYVRRRIAGFPAPLDIEEEVLFYLAEVETCAENRRKSQAESRRSKAMTWTFEGREVTNRLGAAEYLGIAPTTVKNWASSEGRRWSGFPDPLPDEVDGCLVYAVADLAAFKALRKAPPERKVVKTWIVEGREVTNRLGAAEYLGIAPTTVKNLASPGGRCWSGFPDPLVEKVDGYLVYAVADLAAFKASHADR